ncbi:MAG: thioredoxin family protein [Silvanigrellaceae bacterium]|nr:thioredoxin family protein [Silvanigrellaceae bacterium]
MSEFIELIDSNFEENLKGQKTALIDFYAAWCGSCRMAAPMFKRVADEYSLPIFKIDAEKNEKARSMISIKNLPTIALWSEGKIVDSLSTTKEEGLKEFLQKHGIGGA